MRTKASELVTVETHIPKSLTKQIQKAAKQAGCSPNEFIKQALEEWIDQQPNQIDT